MPPRAQSLAGHQSPVECVSFDAGEGVVAAGGQNGTVKLWDLNAQKGARVRAHAWGGLPRRRLWRRRVQRRAEVCAACAQRV